MSLTSLRVSSCVTTTVRSGVPSVNRMTRSRDGRESAFDDCPATSTSMARCLPFAFSLSGIRLVVQYLVHRAFSQNQILSLKLHDIYSLSFLVQKKSRNLSLFCQLRQNIQADAEADGEAALLLGTEAEAVLLAECALCIALVAETTGNGTFGRILPGGPNVTPRFRTSPVSMS